MRGSTACCTRVWSASRNIWASRAPRTRWAPTVPWPRCCATHALGSMVTGDDPKSSVVDLHGKVHGMERLYVGDGSPLPRASRVNPSLTIYAWGLRLGDHLAPGG